MVLYRSAIGQDSHAFADETTPSDKKLLLGGVTIPDFPLSLRANSDGDVLLHALTNAISGITCRNILGTIADTMCKNGITDSAAYLQEALDDLQRQNRTLVHISFSVECAKPRLSPHIDAIRTSVARLTGLRPKDIGLTATSGEGLTAFGLGKGIAVLCIITVAEENPSA